MYSIRIIGCLLAAAALASCAGPAQLGPSQAFEPTGSVPPGAIDAGALEGRIAFMRGDPSEGADVTYTVNPDGSDERQLVPEGNSGFPTWSPDGTEIHVFCCGDGMVAHFADPDTGEIVRAFPQPEPSLEIYCGGWTPDGTRLSCGGFGVEDSSLNGIFTIRTSDGRGLRRITSNPDGEDIPGDFSPTGDRLVFMRFVDDEPVGLFVIGVDGSGLAEISPPDLLLDDSGFAGSWSPDGTQILFVGRAAADRHKEIWIVQADGSSPRRFEMTPSCGGAFSDPSSAGCYSPEWSPDGTMIVFTRSSADGETENIFIVRKDGTGLVQVTSGGADDSPDWGTPGEHVASDPAVIGTWTRTQDCETMLAAFEEAGLVESQGVWVIGNWVGDPADVEADPNDLCADARPPEEHSHFFTADGQFGSLDADGNQVDDGDYVILDADTMSFPSHSEEFGYDGDIQVDFSVSEDSAEFAVQIPSGCDGPCSEAHAWALSAFFGPTAWTRE